MSGLLFRCRVCGYVFHVAQLRDGKVPPHGSPGPLFEDQGCPGAGQPPREGQADGAQLAQHAGRDGA